LYASDRVLEAGLEPLSMDMFGANWLGKDYETRADARRFEQYEFGPAQVLGLQKAVEYALEVGLENIENRVCLLAETLRKGLENLPSARVLDFGEKKCGIVTAHFSGINPQKMLEFLYSKKINCRVSPKFAATLDFREKGVEWVLRVSPHYYNSTAEIEQFLIETSDFLLKK
jgi:selenocysteine lyase/cysteine desulfurase